MSSTQPDGADRFEAWSFIREALVRGCAIEQDTRATGRSYDAHSVRLDAAARELAEQLRPHLVPRVLCILDEAPSVPADIWTKFPDAGL